MLRDVTIQDHGIEKSDFHGHSWRALTSPRAVTDLYAHGLHPHHVAWLLLHVKVYAETTDPELPGSHGVRPQGLAVTRLYRGIIGEPFLQRLQHRGSLPRREASQVSVRLVGQL